MYRVDKTIVDRLVWALVLIPGFLTVSIGSFLSDSFVGSDFQYLYYSIFWSLVILFVVSAATVVFWIPVFLLLIRKLVIFLPLVASNAYSQVEAALRERFPSSLWLRLDRISLLRDFLFLLLTLLSSVVLGITLGYLYSSDFAFERLRDANINHSVISLKRPVALLLESNRNDQLDRVGDRRDPEWEPDAEAEAKRREAMERLYMKEEQRSFIVITTKGDESFAGWPSLYPAGNESSEIHLTPACSFDEKRQCWRKIRGAGVTIYEREIRHLIWTDDAGSACFRLWRPCDYCDEPSTLRICYGERLPQVDDF